MSTDPLTPMPAPAQGSPIARALVLVYGTLTYLGFLGTFLYLIGWTGNFIVPRTIDGAATSALGASIVVNVAILSLFAVQHTVMARGAFKRWWTRFVPEPIERATYCLVSVVAIFWLTPLMTVGHLIFSLTIIACVLAAIQLEERDLEDAIGQDYTDYRTSTPMLLPRLTPAVPKAETPSQRG